MNRGLFRRCRPAVAAVALALAGLASVAAAKPQRIASINVCTDQLLLALADPEQIAGLSPYARDPAASWFAAKAAHFPLLSGQAEDVLLLKPDLVVASRYSKAETTGLLRAQGLHVVEFEDPLTFDDVKAQIRRMGGLVGHPERTTPLLARLDQGLAALRALAGKRGTRLLAVSRRGWVSGSDSLISAMIGDAGLSNAAGQLGFRFGGFASVEAIVNLHPDRLVVEDGSAFAEDQGRAFLLHPALQKLYPPDKRIVIPERMTVCGGPMLADALERLARELARTSP